MALTAVGFVAAHAFLLLLLAATAYVAGRLAMRALAVETAGATEAAALGLVVLATVGCLLGLAGQLARLPLLAAVAAIHLAGLSCWRDGAARALEVWRRRPPLRMAVWPAAAAALLLTVLLAPLFALALYPPTAFDETLYHLPFARAFAASGSLPFLPELRFPVFPQLAEVLSAEMLLLGGDVATHLVALLATGLTACLLVGWGREWGEAQGKPAAWSRAAGWLAAAAFVGNPIAVYLAGTGYVEPLLALFVTAACRAFWRWRRQGGRWLAAAGAFAGAAAGTKYLGLFFVAALALGALAGRPAAVARVPAARLAARGPAGQGAARRAAGCALFVAVSVAAMAPWYGRILAFTGNPLFPYFSGVFGANAWTPVRFRGLAPPAVDAGAVASYLARLATLPWDVVARRQLVGGLPPFSPFYLLAAPLLALAAWRDRGLRYVLAPVAGFVALFPLLPADARYLVTVLPLLSLALGVAGATMLAAAGARRTRLSTMLLAAVLVLPGWLYAGYRLARQGPLPTTTTAREAYLLRSLPLYPAVARLEREMRPGDTAYGLFAEQMRDFVRGGEFRGDWYGPYRYGTIATLLGDPVALGAALRATGVDFLLVARSRAAASSFVEPDEGAGLRAGFALLYEDRDALLYALRPTSGER